MNKDEMGLGTSKEGFLEAATLKEKRDPTAISEDPGLQARVLQDLQWSP